MLYRSVTSGNINNGATSGATFINSGAKADPDGRINGNIGGATSDLNLINVPAGTIFLDKSETAGSSAFGVLTLTVTQSQSSDRKADGGTWFYDPQGSGYAPSIIGVKAGSMYSFWDVSAARTLDPNTGIWSGYWSTEGLVKDNGNFSTLSHLNVYGALTTVQLTTVPLPAALPLFLGGLAGLGLIARRCKVT